MQALGDGLAGGTRAAAAEIAAEDGVRLGDVADRPRPDVLAHRADGLAVVPLVAHLREHVLLLGGLHQGIALGHVVGQRLLHEDRLAQLDRPHRRRGVMVIGRGDEHHVDVLVALVVHLAVVVEGGDVGGPALDLTRSTALPRIFSSTSTRATGRSLAALLGIAAAHAAAGDHGHAELGIGRTVGQHGRGAEPLPLKIGSPAAAPVAAAVVLRKVRRVERVVMEYSFNKAGKGGWGIGGIA